MDSQEKKIRTHMRHILHIVLLTLCAVLCAQAQELLNYPLDTVNGEEVYRYQVERSIGLYRIGVNFNVQQGDIIRLNPQLRERGLHYGETILIPTNRKVVPRKVEKVEKVEKVQKVEEVKKVEAPVQKEEPAVVEIPVVIETIAEEPVPVAEPVVAEEPVAEVKARKVIELALMLPFESQQVKRSNNAERMTEFYQGALLALHELQNDSTLYRLRVYDTERSERRVNALCDSAELDNVQAILGLAYPIQVERMSVWCATHHVPLLLPFSDDADIITNPQILQFNSTEEQRADSLCSWIKKHDVHCIMVDVRDADLASSVRTLREQMRKNDIPYTSIAMYDLVNDSVFHALDKEKENLIILHTDRYPQVRILMPHIAKLQHAGYPIRIVSQYSWQKEEVNLPQVYTSVFTANKSREDYDALWTRYYLGGHSTEVPRYDLLGYDLMNALVAWLNGQKTSEGLQSTIQWQQNSTGGWQNAGLRIVESR